jgi:hypothetical protein
MSLEEEVLAIEEGAAAIVAAARQEARKLLGSLEEGKKKIREEIASRLEREIAVMKDEQAVSLKHRLAETQQEKERELAKIAKAQEGNVRRLSEEVVSKLLAENPGRQ